MESIFRSMAMEAIFEIGSTVLDHCKGIELAYMEGKAGHCYNIGGRNERNNNQIAHTICTLLDAHKPKDSGSYKDQIRFVEDRAGHDFRYAIDATKIEGDLGWNAKENFESGDPEDNRVVRSKVLRLTNFAEY